jgi:methionyl-tRNA formyltransferase
VNFDKQLSKYFSALGRKSVQARMKSLSAKERKEIAQNAAKARWAKKKRKKK